MAPVEELKRDSDVDVKLDPELDMVGLRLKLELGLVLAGVSSMSNCRGSMAAPNEVGVEKSTWRRWFAVASKRAVEVNRTELVFVSPHSEQVSPRPNHPSSSSSSSVILGPNGLLYCSILRFGFLGVPSSFSFTSPSILPSPEEFLDSKKVVSSFSRTLRTFSMLTGIISVAVSLVISGSSSIMSCSSVICWILLRCFLGC